MVRSRLGFKSEIQRKDATAQTEKRWNAHIGRVGIAVLCGCLDRAKYGQRRYACTPRANSFFWERAFGLDALSIHLEAISAVLFGTVKCLVGAPQ